jgi:alpha-mannosidase
MSDASDYTIHMIGHGHIDPTWLWRWTEGYEEVRATFRSALDRMNETPEFRFTASSACFYQWIKETDPAMFEEIRVRVAEGRWELAGGFWVEPDCNIPCGESFVRQGLYSQRFFQREFGLRAKAGFNPDSFGHAGTLPQILRKLGLHYYVYMRPSPVTEMEYPGGTTFWWESQDGTRVLACNLPVAYDADQNVIERISRLPELPQLSPGQYHILGFYGVGNHGGGPTKRAIRAILDACEDSALPNTLFSTLEGYFSAFEAETPAPSIPVIRNELQYHARGCYSAHAGVKRLNRAAEHELMSAERLAAAAWLLHGRDFPKETFEEGWKNLLYNQFHDILAGTSLESSYEDTQNQIGAARHCAATIANLAVQRIAREIDTTPEGNTIVVFNSLPWVVRQPVIVAPIIERGVDAPFHFVDDEDRVVPSQSIAGERIGNQRYTFLAELPAMGYRCYHVRSGARLVERRHGLEAGRHSLENDWWRIEFDPDSGQIGRLFDKHAKLDVLRKGNVLAVLVDASDTWSHDLREYRTEAGRFGGAAFALEESGEVQATLRISSRFRQSEAIQRITIYRESPVIDVDFRINWQEAHHALKLCFETNIEEGIPVYEAPYGHQQRRATGEEEPGQQYFDLSGLIDGASYGFTVINNGQYGFDVRDGEMRVTLLRSPAYGHHDPSRFEAGAGWPIMDQGWHRMHFRLIPHSGAWDTADIPRQAWEMNVPPRVHIESAHPGTLGPCLSLLDTGAGNVLIGVVKQSEEGKDLIVRGYESHGQSATVHLRLPHFDQSYELEFAPHEIKTIRIDLKTWTIREVNLLEEMDEGSPASSL